MFVYVFLFFFFFIIIFIINQRKKCQRDSYTSAQPTNLSPGIVYPSTGYHRPILGVDCTTDCPYYNFYPTREKLINNL